MKSYTTPLLLVSLTTIIVVSIILLCKKEAFEYMASTANLADGVYSITSKSGAVLTSNLIDTVMCKDFLIGQTKPSSDNSWMLKRVAQGVYIFYKQGKKECLYTHPTNDIRSYFFPSCDTSNLCGLTEPDYKGQLDQDSLRTYFMILTNPQGKFFIKSMKNDKYLCMTNNQIKLLDSPDDNCLFDIKQV